MKNLYSQIYDFQTKKNININSDLGQYIISKYLNKIGGGTAPTINGPCPKSSDFYCPIGGDYMTDPVICSDGYSYQRANIRTWLLSNNTSPMTSLILANRVLIPNICLRNAIREYRRWLAEEEKKMSSIEDKVNLASSDGEKATVKPTLEADSSYLEGESSASVKPTSEADSSNQESEPPVSVERSAPSTTISRLEGTEDKVFEDEDEDEEENEDEDEDLLDPPDKFWDELENVAWEYKHRLSIKGNEDRYEVNTILKKIWAIMMERTTGAKIDINKKNSTPHFLVMMMELGILEKMYIYYFGEDSFYRDASPSQMLIKICNHFERLGEDIEDNIAYLIFGSD